MKQKILKVGLIGGFILFVWGAVSWTVLPFQKAYMCRFTDEKEVQRAIGDNANCDGVYMVPSRAPAGSSQEEQDAANARINRGPVAMVAVAMHGQSSSMAGRAVANLIFKIVLVSLATWLMFYVGGLDFNKTIRYFTMLGIIVALASAIPLWIWFTFPAGFVIGMMIETAIGWFIVGLAAARMLHPKKDRKEA